MTQAEVKIVELLLRFWRRRYPANHTFHVLGARDETACKRMVEQGLLERAPDRGPGVYRVNSRII